MSVLVPPAVKDVQAESVGTIGSDGLPGDVLGSRATVADAFHELVAILYRLTKEPDGLVLSMLRAYAQVLVETVKFRCVLTKPSRACDAFLESWGAHDDFNAVPAETWSELHDLAKAAADEETDSDRQVRCSPATSLREAVPLYVASIVATVCLAVGFGLVMALCDVSVAEACGMGIGVAGSIVATVLATWRRRPVLGISTLSGALAVAAALSPEGAGVWYLPSMLTSMVYMCLHPSLTSQNVARPLLCSLSTVGAVVHCIRVSGGDGVVSVVCALTLCCAIILKLSIEQDVLRKLSDALLATSSRGMGLVGTAAQRVSQHPRNVPGGTTFMGSSTSHSSEIGPDMSVPMFLVQHLLCVVRVGADGNVINWSRHLEMVTERTAGGVVGRPFVDVIGADERLRHCLDPESYSESEVRVVDVFFLSESGGKSVKLPMNVCRKGDTFIFVGVSHPGASVIPHQKIKKWLVALNRESLAGPLETVRKDLRALVGEDSEVSIDRWAVIAVDDIVTKVVDDIRSAASTKAIVLKTAASGLMVLCDSANAVSYLSTELNGLVQRKQKGNIMISATMTDCALDFTFLYEPNRVNDPRIGSTEDRKREEVKRPVRASWYAPSREIEGAHQIPVVKCVGNEFVHQVNDALRIIRCPVIPAMNASDIPKVITSDPGILMIDATTERNPTELVRLVESVCPTADSVWVVVVFERADRIDDHSSPFLKLNCRILQAPVRIGSLFGLLKQVLITCIANRGLIARARALLGEHRPVRWTRGRHLGGGAHSDVYEAVCECTGGKMAVKILRFVTGTEVETEQFALTLMREIEIMSMLEHNNVLQYLYCERAYKSVYIFMEYGGKGTVRQRLKKSGRMARKDIAATLKGVLRGVQYLHSLNVVHRDIKADNIMYVEDGTAKIGDFGSATVLGPGVTLHHVEGTPGYMAPEVINARPYDWRVDIWSIGCLAMEMATGMPPFAHISKEPFGVVTHIGKLGHSDTVALPDGLDGAVAAFLRATLTVDPQQRPTSEALLEYELVAAKNENNNNDE